MKPKSTLRSFLAIASTSLLAISYTQADTFTWDNSNVAGTPAATLDWFTGGPNSLGLWTGPAIPLSSNTNAIQFFANTTTNLTHTGNPSNQTANINNSGSAFQLGTLTLSGKGSTTAAAKLNLTISGDALNFSAATGTINLDAINQSATQTITNNLNSNIQLGAIGTAGALTLTGNGTSAFNIGGIISELQAGGSVIKNGTSAVTLSGNNSFTGGITMNAGSLVLTGTQSFTGGITLNGGATTIGATATVGAHNNNAISATSNSILTYATMTTTSAISLSGGVMLDLRGNTSTFTTSGAVTGAGGIILGQSGSGATTLNFNNASNTFSGPIEYRVSVNSGQNGSLSVNSIGDAVTLGSGDIRFGVAGSGTNAHIFNFGGSVGAPAGPLTFSTRRFELTGTHLLSQINNASAENFTINTDLLVTATAAQSLTLGGGGAGISTYVGKIADNLVNAAGVVSLTKAGAGTWILSNTANAYTGITNIAGGTLRVPALADGGSNSSIGVSSNAAGNLILSGGTLRYTGGLASTNRTLSLATTNSSIDASGSGALTFSNTGALNPDVTGLTGTFTLNNATVTNLASTAGMRVGMTVISGAYAGTRTINSINSGSSITLSSATSVTAGDFSVDGGTPTARTLILTGTNTDTNTIAGVLQNSTATGTPGVVSLTKSGIGTWVLGGINTYTGATTVSSGTLIAPSNAPSGANGAFGNATSEISMGVAGGSADASILIGGAFNVGRIVRLATNNNSDAGFRVLTLGGNTAHNSEFSGDIILGTNSQAGRGVTLTAANGGQVTFSGVIQNPSPMDATTYTVTKAGLGTVVLSNTSNSYTGATTVSEGRLLLGANDVLPNTTKVTIAAATLDAATFDETVGTLDVTAATATINLGSGANLVFAASNLVDWTDIPGTLNITGTLNFSGGPSSSLRFGTTNTGPTAGLTAGQLLQISSPGWTNFALDVDGYLTATSTGGSSAYDTWKAANAPGSNPGDDTDGDGVSNAVEFVLGGTALTKDLGKLPAVATSGGNITFTFKRAQSSIDAKTALQIETSTDLVTWNIAPSPYTVPDGAAAVVPGVTVVKGVPTNFDTVTLTVPQAPDAKKFARLKVVITP